MLRSEVRRRAGAFTLTALFAIVTGGAALTAAAGARRSNTVYARFLEWSGRPDFGTGGGDPKDMIADRKAIEHAPFVGAIAHISGANLLTKDTEGVTLYPFQMGVIADVDGVLARGPVNREKVIRGRHADPNAADEATVTFPAAARLGVDVGDRLPLYPPSGQGEPIEVKVVGVTARPGEFPNLSGASVNSVALTSAFKTKYARTGIFDPGNDDLVVHVRDGVSRQEVSDWLRAHVKSTDIEDASGSTASTSRTIRIETVALWSVAAVLALVFFVLLGQALLRFASSRSDDITTCGVLGFTRVQVVALGAARGVVIGVVGAVGAVVLAVLASPLTPVGLGALAEPHPGIRVDAPVLGWGALAIVAATATLGAVAAVVSQRWASGRARSPRRAVPLPKLPPAAFAGLHLLVRPVRRRDAGVARVTIASLCFVVAMLVATFTMLGSLSHLRDTPALAGATWDATVQPHAPDNEDTTPADTQRALDTLPQAPNVVAVNTTGWQSLYAGAREINGVQVFGDGSIQPAIASGRVPRGPGEIALGGEEMRRLHVSIGDTIELAVQPGASAKPMKIVGRSVLVSPIFLANGPGQGGATTVAAMQELGERREQSAPLVLVRFAPGTDVARALPIAANQTGDNFAFTARDRTIGNGVDRVRVVPEALVVILAILGIIGLIHVLVVSARRRRGETAVLRAIGFTRGDVLTTVGTYAVAVVTIAIVVGVPAGILVGRFGWGRFADYLRVVPEPSVPRALVALGTLALLVGAVLAVVPIGRRAGRIPPGPALRTETG